MNKIYKIRIILDTEKDVFRDIEIEGNSTLFQLHQTIKNSFGLKGDEMASFYLSNDEWFQGSEIPMESMDESQEETMHNLTLAETLPKVGAKMIYVYDFLALWTFYVEVIAIEPKEKGVEYPRVVLAYGDTPEQAPEYDSMEFDLYMDELDDEDDDDVFGSNGSLDEYNDDYNW